MKRMKKLIAASLVAIMLAATLVGCGAKFDAGKYVESCLDLLTKGETKDYVKMTKRSEEQAQQDYEDNINSMIETMGVEGLSADLEDDYKQLFKDIYAKSKYKVTGSEKMDGKDGYIVTVEVEQMTGLFNGLQEELMAEVETYMSGLTEMPTDEEINNTVFQMMLDLMNARLDSITYNAPQTVTVEVVGEDNVYSITDAGYAALDAALLDVDM